MCPEEYHGAMGLPENDIVAAVGALFNVSNVRTKLKQSPRTQPKIIFIEQVRDTVTDFFIQNSELLSLKLSQIDLHGHLLVIRLAKE